MPRITKYRSLLKETHGGKIVDYSFLKFSLNFTSVSYKTLSYKTFIYEIKIPLKKIARNGDPGVLVLRATKPSSLFKESLSRSWMMAPFVFPEAEM